jgi:hypothetical protein
MIDFSTIQKKVYELGAKGGIPINYLKIFNSSPQDGTPHIQLNDETYDYVIEERGCEFSRRKTSNLDELLYWILNDASSRYAFDYELQNRIPDQDPRRIAFSLKIEIMKNISPDWSYQIQKHVNETLKNSPYVD